MNKYEKAYAKSYHRHGKYSIEYVRKLWENSKKVYESTGEWPIIDVGNGVCVTMDSDRYSNFFINGTDCVSCGLKGEYFWLETFNVKKSKSGAYYKNKWHFNLYGIGTDGCEMQLTKDHIIPRAAGGADSLDNYQPMCERCNEKKADKVA